MLLLATRLSGLLLGLLLGLGLCLPSAWAANDATHRALDALFTLPEVQLEGVGVPDAPEGWHEGDDLVAYFAQQKAAGADLNAYRFLGTALHHAVRTRQTELAAWLLKNGANPFLKIRSEPLDTLGVAVRVANWDAAELLIRHDLALLKKTGPGAEAQAALARASVDAAWQTAGEHLAGLDALLTRLHWPWTPAQQTARWQARLQAAVCSGTARNALALLKAVPVELAGQPLALPRDPQGGDCPGSTRWPAQAELPGWKPVDALLPQPLLATRTPHLPDASAGTAALTLLRAALAQGLRAPWATPEGAQAYLYRVGWLPPAQAMPLIHLMPEPVLRALLNNPAQAQEPNNTVAYWTARAFNAPEADFRAWLNLIEPTQMARIQRSLLQQLSERQGATNWATLTERLVAPVQTVTEGFPSHLPASLWPAWQQLGLNPSAVWWAHWAQTVPLNQLPELLPKARAIVAAAPRTGASGNITTSASAGSGSAAGARNGGATGAWPSDLDWARWLLRTEPKTLPIFWALFKAQRPDLLPRALDWALAPLALGATPDAVASELSVSGDAWNLSTGEAWQRVRWLSAQGLRTQHPRLMAYPMGNTDIASPSLDDAVAQGWALRPSAAAAPLALRWQTPQLSCRQEADAPLRKALAANQMLDGESERRVWEHVLPVQVPSQPVCQWLFTGGDWGGRKFIEEPDFFSGITRLTPCADGWRAAMFWHTPSATWVDSGLDPRNSELFSLQTADPPGQWLGLGLNQQGGCGQSPGDVAQVERLPDGKVRLVPLAPMHPVRAALLAQCGVSLALEECEVLAPHRLEALGVPGFIDQFWGEARQAFLTALLANDRSTLAAQREAGLFAQWLDAGLVALGRDTQLSLADKRKRAAWVLAQSQPAPLYLTDTLASLVSWLPPEDWRPIVRRRGCTPGNPLGELPGLAQQPALAQRLARELDTLECANGP